MKEHLRSNRTARVPKRNLERNGSEFQSNNEICKKRKEKNIKDYLIDYTASTHLHGLRYIGEKKNTPAEKAFWLFIFLLCVIYCAILIQQVWMKWVESPVMVSFAEKLTPAWQIPYPAVTICFSTKALPMKFNFTKYYHLYFDNATRSNLTEEKKHILEDFFMICDDNMWTETDGSKFTDGNLTVTNIKNLSAKFTLDSAICEWGNYSGCQDFFSPIITEEGLCQTFNTLHPQQLFRIENLHDEYEYMPMGNSNSQQSWIMDEGYAPSAPLKTYPYRGSGNGGKDNLLIQISTYGYNLDYVCSNVQGYKIFLHNPAELPRFSRHYIKLPLSQEVRIAVKPKMMTTTEGLKGYNPLRRQCYFSKERYLQYFKTYTQTNCEIECLANFTHARCGCVHFGLPHGPNMKTCGAGSKDCMTTAQSKQAFRTGELVQLQIEFGMEAETSDNDNIGVARAVAAQCTCLPACTSIEYEAETSQAEVDVKALNRAYKMNDSDESFLSATIYLKEPQFTTVVRSELYGRVDFLANCGGLLGLFMGFSVLSVVEIVYFLTLRWWCVITKNRRIQEEFNETHVN